jgi:HEAT repeat protein
MASKRKAGNSSKSAGKPKGGAKRSALSALKTATNERKTVKERVEALAEAPLAVCENDESLQAMLKVLRDKAEPVEVRLAALQSLQAASFSVIAFEACRSDYIAALREVAEDADPELRQRVLGLLAREKDGFAQKKLLEGLQNPEKALVPPEKALQLLSYDVHAEAYSVARKIVSNPPNPVARREALRLLAADATAAPLFEKILLDKDESPEIRQISASALHAINPEKMQASAREILLDKSEQAGIQATSLTALTQFGDDAAIAGDDALLKSVDRLSDEGPTRVKQHARRFLSKYGR